METLIYWLAPRGVLGFVIRLAILIAVMAAANILFWMFFDGYNNHSYSSYIIFAIVVDGPFIAFFLMVTVFQMRLQRKFRRLSRKDELTDLYNRRTFFELVSDMVVNECNGVLLLLDADWFKAVNDTHGHQVGDNCLKSIAATLRQNLRQNDIVGRIGGEEFGIYLMDTTLRQARVIGERMTKPIAFESTPGQTATVTLSIGAAVYADKTSMKEMFANADIALYRAKREGRAKMVFWDEALCLSRTQEQA